MLAEKLVSVKPFISSEDRPAQYSHLKVNAKRQITRNQQNEELKKENKTLVNKLSHIMNGQASFDHINSQYIIKKNAADSPIKTKQEPKEIKEWRKMLFRHRSTKNINPISTYKSAMLKES